MTRLELLIAAIERQEGFPRPGTLPTRLNNPGDLIFANQRGAVPYAVTGADGKVRVFASFRTLADGIHALKIQIMLDAQAKRHETLSIFISHYAPVTDGNNTSVYLAGVMKDLGVTDSSVLLADVIDPAHDDPEVALLEQSLLPRGAAPVILIPAPGAHFHLTSGQPLKPSCMVQPLLSADGKSMTCGECGFTMPADAAVVNG